MQGWTERPARLYTTRLEVLTQTVRFELNISANKTTYAIYQVSVSALGRQTSEVGDLIWKFAQPVLMYTLRKDAASGADER